VTDVTRSVAARPTAGRGGQNNGWFFSSERQVRPALASRGPRAHYSAMTELGNPAAEATSVRFEIEVAAPIEHAFRVFTEGFDSWWPRDHHIGRVDMAVAILEPRVGGRWYELGVDGSECEWGMVLAWDPPRHVAVSWHLDGEFRFDPRRERASRVDIRFEPRGSVRTQVILEHSGLDRHGDTWPLLRERISRGWPTDLRLLGAAIEASWTGAATGLPSVS
jgi:uncharacterized protein YndB with AHSA1/START domain